MAKIPYDKYYTPPRYARFCINKAYEIIGKENITEVIEPSAGSGTFSNQMECIAYDLFPQSEKIIEMNFLDLDIKYKKGRLFIGNPPFGDSSGKLLNDFYNKCTETGDYIAWILPVGYYSNYSSFNKFEIVYQAVIEVEYSNVKIKTAYMIYKRNPDQSKWSSDIDIKSITFSKHQMSNLQKNPRIQNQDYTFISFGKILYPCKPYEKCGTISVNVDEKYRADVLLFLKWLYYYNRETQILSKWSVSADNVSINRLKRLIKIAIPDIE